MEEVQNGLWTTSCGFSMFLHLHISEGFTISSPSSSFLIFPSCDCHFSTLPWALGNNSICQYRLRSGIEIFGLNQEQGMPRKINDKKSDGKIPTFLAS